MISFRSVLHATPLLLMLFAMPAAAAPSSDRSTTIDLAAEAERPAANDLARAVVFAEASGATPNELAKQVNSLINDPDPASRALLLEQRNRETDAGVQEVMALVLALMDLSSPEPETRVAAIQGLDGALHSQVRGALTKLLERETDPRARSAAQRVLEGTEARIRWYATLETLFFGLSLGSVLVLAAIGLAITFGVMGVINMAHGELMMLGAYTTYVIQQWLPDQIGISVFIAIPAAFVVAGLVGVPVSYTHLTLPTNREV